MTGASRSKIVAVQLRPVIKRIFRAEVRKIRKRQKLYKGKAHFGVDEESDTDEEEKYNIGELITDKYR